MSKTKMMKRAAKFSNCKQEYKFDPEYNAHIYTVSKTNETYAFYFGFHNGGFFCSLTGVKNKLCVPHIDFVDNPMGYSIENRTFVNEKEWVIKISNHYITSDTAYADILSLGSEIFNLCQKAMEEKRGK